ncbi:MAG: hypothetical protein H6720_03440 [Sandaracinus sp.]|nr:hypothetical protein [Sandaracinus sp.]
MRRLLDDRRGLSTTEYLILLSLIALGGYLAWRRFGDHVDYGVRSSATILLEDD